MKSIASTLEPIFHVIPSLTGKVGDGRDEVGDGDCFPEEPVVETLEGRLREHPARCDDWPELVELGLGVAARDFLGGVLDKRLLLKRKKEQPLSKYFKILDPQG